MTATASTAPVVPAFLKSGKPAPLGKGTGRCFHHSATAYGQSQTSLNMPKCLLFRVAKRKPPTG